MPPCAESRPCRARRRRRQANRARIALRGFLVGIIGVLALTACATKGYVNKRVDAQAAAQTAALDSERTARMQADEANKAAIASLRSDLQNLRTEFGAKITEVGGGYNFVAPVYFAHGSATLREEEGQSVDRFASVVNRYYQGAIITVRGHSDRSEERGSRIVLSRRRATAVRDRLVAHGLETSLTRAVGVGSAEEIVPGAVRSQPDALLNRRVNFVIETRGTAEPR